MVAKTISIVICILSILLIGVLVVSVVLSVKKLNSIDFLLEKANKNITPELKTMYGLTDKQCEQVYAGMFILSAISEEDTKKIMRLEDKKIKKIAEGKLNLRFVLASDIKEQINEDFGSGTIPKKIVDLIKTPSNVLEFNEDFRTTVEKLISDYKTKETLLRKKINNVKNYNIVEAIIAAMPELLSSLVVSE
ncbi:hypothetical protein NGRA_2351 [Nosema granulosis]|uniref:Uncharacterized protein n=1 Tax=Nosema granulosis TaxID=83296 RepID=A0A9P6KYR0_9MICR|nr:hypothetical protein NGRA_2351 [Nosema granulosis]